MASRTDALPLFSVFGMPRRPKTHGLFLTELVERHRPLGLQQAELDAAGVQGQVDSWVEVPCQVLAG